MKNSLTMKMNLFLSLFFLSVISPLLFGNNYVNAQTATPTTTPTTTTTTTVTPSSADDNAFTRTLCNVLRIVTGTGGKAFAAFAIISLGIGFFTGKVSWGLMVGVTAGIAAMFGAPTIVAAISGTSASTCTTGQVTSPVSTGS